MTGLDVKRDDPDAADYLARFRRKIGANAAGWLDFLQLHSDDHAALDRELANLRKAVQQALAEPAAWDPGLALAGQAWQHIEQRGHWLAWQEILGQALEVCRRARRTVDEAHFLDQRGELARLLGDNQGALRHFQAALRLQRTAGDDFGAGRVLTHLSQIYLTTGDLAAAIACCQEAASIFEALNDQGELAIARNNWGIVLLEQGATEDALDKFHQAAAGFQAVGNRRGLAKAVGNQGDALWRLARWTETVDCYRQAIAIDEQIGHEVHAARIRMNLGILFHEQGRDEEALALHLEVEPFFRRFDDRPLLARVHNNMGIFLARLDRFGESQAAFDRAVSLYLAMDDRLLATDTLTNCAEHLLDQGRSDEAADYLRRSRALLDTLPSPPDYLRRDWTRQWERLAAQPVVRTAG